MDLAPTRLVAAAIAVLANALLFWWLWIYVPAPVQAAFERLDSLQDDALQVVWIKPAPRTADRLVPPASEPGSELAALRPRVAMTPNATGVSALAEPNTHDGPELAVIGNDQWDHPSAADPSDPEVVFKPRSFLERSSERQEGKRRFKFAMRDSSLLGRLGRMSHTSACSYMQRLARANDTQLREQGTTRELVLRSMQAENC